MLQTDIPPRGGYARSVDGYLERLADPLISELLETLPAVSLVGPRAAGKTTTAVRHAGTVKHLAAEGDTLEPGDVIMTGTPGEPGEIKRGDVVEVELEGVGTLSNPVVAEE